MTARKTIRRKPPVAADHSDFYETMPLTMGSHYVYRDDVHDNYYDGADGHLDAQGYDATIRRVAIITLVASAIVAVLAGFMFVQGLSSIRDAMPVNSTSTLGL